MEKRYQIFVSSTYTDLVEERKEVTQAILKCDCFPAGMELFPASNKTQWDIIKKVIDDSDFYLLIIAGRYGSLGHDDNGSEMGYTEMEFNYALKKKKPILVFLRKNLDDLPNRLTEQDTSLKDRLERFRESASTGRMVTFWDNKDQLHSAVLESLHNELKDTSNVVGWVRADSTGNDVETKNLTFTYHCQNLTGEPDFAKARSCIKALMENLRCEMIYFDAGRNALHAGVRMPVEFPRRYMDEIIRNKLKHIGIDITGHGYT